MLSSMIFEPATLKSKSRHFLFGVLIVVLTLGFSLETVANDAPSPTVLVDFGSSSFVIDPLAVSDPSKFTQTAGHLRFSIPWIWGETLGGVFTASRNWGGLNLKDLGILMSCSGSNGNAAFSIALFDQNFNLIDTLFGSTSNVGSSFTFVPVALIAGTDVNGNINPNRGTGDLSNIAGAQFTWDSSPEAGQSPDITIHGLALVDAPPSTPIDKTPPSLLVTSPAKGSAVTRAQRVVLQGTTSDNVAPTNVQFRLRAPGRRSYGACVQPA
jgi:hypothetical protein